MRKTLKNCCVAVLALASCDAVALDFNQKGAHSLAALPNGTAGSSGGKFAVRPQAAPPQSNGFRGFGRFPQNNNRNGAFKQNSFSGFAVRPQAASPQSNGFRGFGRFPQKNNENGAFKQNSFSGLVARARAASPQPNVVLAPSSLVVSTPRVQAQASQNSGIKVAQPKPPRPTSARTLDPTLPNGLCNVGNTCYLNSALQLLNAIKPFRETIMYSSSTHPVVVTLQEIFKGLDSPGGIPYDQLREKVEKILKNEHLEHFILGEQHDALAFIGALFGILDWWQGCPGAEEEATKCFQFKCDTIIREKANLYHSRHRREQDWRWMVAIKKQPEGREIPDEFMQALRDWGADEELTGENQWEFAAGKKVDATLHRRIDTMPQVFFMPIMRYYGDPATGRQVKNNRPMAIPFEFELPEEIILNDDPVKYKLIGGIIHLGTTIGSGHYIAYIATKDGFIKFNDASVSRLSTQEGLNELKSAYAVAYERQ
jgi:hypothetical protein